MTDATLSVYLDSTPLLSVSSLTSWLHPPDHDTTRSPGTKVLQHEVPALVRGATRSNALIVPADSIHLAGQRWGVHRLSVRVSSPRHGCRRSAQQRRLVPELQGPRHPPRPGNAHHRPGRDGGVDSERGACHLHRPRRRAGQPAVPGDRPARRARHRPAHHRVHQHPRHRRPGNRHRVAGTAEKRRQRDVRAELRRLGHRRARPGRRHPPAGPDHLHHRPRPVRPGPNALAGKPLPECDAVTLRDTDPPATDPRGAPPVGLHDRLPGLARRQHRHREEPGPLLNQTRQHHHPELRKHHAARRRHTPRTDRHRREAPRRRLQRHPVRPRAEGRQPPTTTWCGATR